MAIWFDTLLVFMFTSCDRKHEYRVLAFIESERISPVIRNNNLVIINYVLHISLRREYTSMNIIILA